MRADGRDTGAPAPDAESGTATPHDDAFDGRRSTGVGTAALLATLAVATAGCGGGGGGGDAGSGLLASLGLAPSPVATPVGDGAGTGTGDAGGTTPGDPGSGSSTAPVELPPDTYAPVPESDGQAARFLLQAQFATSTADIARVRRIGYDAWLDEQFAAPRGTSGWDWLNQQGYNRIDWTQIFQDNPWPGWDMAWNQLMTRRDQLRCRLALALSEFFVVSGLALEVRWRSHGVAAWWDMLVDSVDGNFRTLLERVTVHPMMGFYLNTRNNEKADPQTGRRPDENFARELMQLFTIGLYELNPDGTRQLVGGQPVETYGLADVTQLAQVFTGYVIDERAGYDGDPADPQWLRVPMRIIPEVHSPEAVRAVGLSIPAGTDADRARAMTLDHLFAHPNVGPFFSRQMIQRLVTSNPSRSYVARVARVFADNGQGVRGDLKAVFKAILLDPEARGARSLGDPAFGRIREPMVRLAQWARTFGASSLSGRWRTGNYSDAESLGQQPLWAPSVFNYFRPGYVPPQTKAAAAGLVVPEMQIVNESTVAAYLNFIQGVIEDGLGNGDVTAGYAEELPLAGDPAALVARLSLLLCAGQLSATTQRAIVDAVTTIDATTDAGRRARVRAAVLLAMAAPEYLVQK